jgi:DNA-binding response OmpR family regulator
LHPHGLARSSGGLGVTCGEPIASLATGFAKNAEGFMARLLIIDDEPHAAAALAMLLRHKGHDVACADNVGSGLTRLKKDRPDLVVLDLGLPRVDGLELLEALAGEPAFEDLRIAVYSGRDDREAIEMARRLGACDYILKGPDFWQTCERIESCLSRPA